MQSWVMFVSLVAAAAVGALVTGLSLYFAFPEIRGEEAEPEVTQASFTAQVSSAFCELEGEGVAGTVLLKAAGDYVVISANVTGLTRGQHGFHIHQLGVLGGDCLSTEGHYNPHGYDHAGPNATERHIGDLGNIESKYIGEGTLAVVEITDRIVSLSPPYSVVGRSVVIHEGEDDLGASGDPSGAAGARVACCTIAVGA